MSASLDACENTVSLTNDWSACSSAAGFLRGQLGRRVRIHTTPQLRFVHDRSVERGASMSALIDEAIAVQGKD